MKPDLLPVTQAREAPAKLRRFVYVVGPAAGPFKIGSTSDMALRMPSLQHASPVDLVLHHLEDVWPSGQEASTIERAAHFLLDVHRMRGEWFDLESPAIAVAAIRQAIDMAVLDAKRIEIAREVARQPYGPRRVTSRTNTL